MHNDTQKDILNNDTHIRNSSLKSINQTYKLCTDIEENQNPFIK